MPFFQVLSISHQTFKIWNKMWLLHGAKVPGRQPGEHAPLYSDIRMRASFLNYPLSPFLSQGEMSMHDYFPAHRQNPESD